MNKYIVEYTTGSRVEITADEIHFDNDEVSFYVDKDVVANFNRYIMVSKAENVKDV